MFRQLMIVCRVLLAVSAEAPPPTQAKHHENETICTDIIFPVAEYGPMAW
jgi:hypothetical protein